MYTGVRRWLRESPIPPVLSDQSPTPEVLNTGREALVFDQLNNSAWKVRVQCYHLKSQWGKLEDANAWIPYIQLHFLDEPKLQDVDFIVEVMPNDEMGTVDLGCPSMSKLVLYPKTVRGGARLNAEREWELDINPTISVAGGEVAPGSMASRFTRTYENAIDKKTLWEIRGWTHRNPFVMVRFPRQATWRLEAKGRDASIPKEINAGIIISHKPNEPLVLAIEVKGTIRERMLGYSKFRGISDRFQVQVPASGVNAAAQRTAQIVRVRQ